MLTGVKHQADESDHLNFDLLETGQVNIDDTLNEAHNNDEKDDEKDDETYKKYKPTAHTIPQIDANQLKYEKKQNNENDKNKKVLGSGKFGIVYFGTYKNKHDEKDAAIKQYKHEQDYLHEMNVIKHIYNSNIPNKYANLIEPYGVFNQLFVMEFMSTGAGDTLLYDNSDKNIRNKLYILDTLDILIDVANGMKCLNDMGIIHRDLSARNLLFKPSNTHNSDHNKKYIVKICDFGECEINKNTTQYRKGPYLWLSPESVRKQICNVQTDIYSFGILCYELIIGTRPLPNTPVEVAIIEILCLSQRPNMSMYCKLIPLQLFILVQMCWQQIAEYRPNDFKEILMELNKLRVYMISHKHCVNTRLDEIKFDKNKSKEMLKDLSYLICEYLSIDESDAIDDNNEEIKYKKKTKHALLKKIFSYKFNEESTIPAVNFYLDHFPWGEQKQQEQHMKAVNNVDQCTKQYDVRLRFGIMSFSDQYPTKK